MGAMFATFQASDMVTDGRFDPGAMVLVIVAAVWYLTALRRVRTAGQTDTMQSFHVNASWRTIAWLAALAVIVVATMSGLGTRATTNVTIHMIDDTLLLMVAPVLAVLGAPVTLAFAASGRRGRDRIRTVVGGRVLAFLTSAVVVWLLLGGLLIWLYFGGLYQATVDHRSIAGLVDLGLLVAGYLFAWKTVGVDPLPRTTNPARSRLQRMIILFLSLPCFTVLGMALDSQPTPIATGSSISQLHAGGEVVWSAGVMLGIGGIIAVLASWVRQEERAAVRRDHADEGEAAAQLALWRATREAITMEETLARATVVGARPGPAGPGGHRQAPSDGAEGAGSSERR